MFRISNQAYGQFADAAEAAYIRKLAAFLRANAPGMATEPDETLLPQVAHVVQRARAFGFSSEREVATFALTAALLGADFADQVGGAREILELQDTAARRAELLQDFTRELFEVLES